MSYAKAILTISLECFRNHTKGGFKGGFLFRINVKKVKPFAQPLLGLSPNAISCNVIEYADECLLIAIF